MTEKQKNIIDNTKFEINCAKYGFDLYNFDIFTINGDDVIVCGNPCMDVYVLFDRNFNAIGVERWDTIIDVFDKKDFVAAFYQAYCNPLDVPSYSKYYQEPLSYPFAELTLKQIMDISNRVIIHETNHGHSFNLLVNWDIVNGDDDKTYVGLLSYIKFLGEQIQKYYLNSYQLKVLGFEFPNVYTYIQSIINRVDAAIDICIKNNRRPFPIDIIKYLGQHEKSIGQYENMLYPIIDLLMEQKGYKAKAGLVHYKEIEPIAKDPDDLSTLSVKLLKILDFSDEEFAIRAEGISENMGQKGIGYIDLKDWLTQKSEKPKIPVFKK